MNTIEEAVNSLMRYDNFVLTTHLNPDGDALGSLLGLGLALLNTGKNVVMIMPHPVPGTFQFLPGVQQVQQTVDCLERFDVGIALDCADFNRIGEETRDQLRKTKTLINIDHHVSNQHFGDINIVDPQAAATGEIICDILLETKIPITSDVATNLYTALVTDTGSFQHHNTTAKCFRTAAFLLECGALHRVVQQNLYEQRSLESLRLLARGLDSLSLNENATIAWMTICRDSFLASGASVDDCDGMIDYVKSLKGVEVGILFKEVNSDEIKVSFRSKNYLDVNQLAAYFGGGGHERAAGCSIKGKIEDVKPLVIRKTEEQMAAENYGGLGR
ncbi:MAG: bifunctional oligoribonuclease/PAP phosphatase NrnA [Syntrophaceticus sp.]